MYIWDGLTVPFNLFWQIGMKNFIVLLAALLFTLFISACSSSDSASNDSQYDQQEAYVFDEVIQSDSVQTEEPADVTPPPPPAIENPAPAVDYIIQLGAFTTLVRAEEFIKENQSKIVYPMSASFSDEVKLYVVQIPPYNSRSDAETVRDILWQTPVFKDAFIITKSKN